MATWSLNQQGRRPVKFPSPLFKGGRGPGAAPRSLPAGSEMPFRREPFCRRSGVSERNRRIAAALSAERLCFFLFAIQKERRKPPALHRGRRSGRGAAGLLVTNGGSRLELKSPPGRCQGDARAAYQKHPGGMFLRPQKTAQFVPPLRPAAFFSSRKSFYWSFSLIYGIMVRKRPLYVYSKGVRLVPFGDNRRNRQLYHFASLHGIMVAERLLPPCPGAQQAANNGKMQIYNTSQRTKKGTIVWNFENLPGCPRKSSGRWRIWAFPR